MVAARFHQTLLPALEALTSLLPLARDHEDLEMRLRDADRQYLGSKPVLEALDVNEPLLLREALKKRFEWFQRDPQLAKFVNYRDEGEDGGS
jgi:hypothetical protein